MANSAPRSSNLYLILPLFVLALIVGIACLFLFSGKYAVYQNEEFHFSIKYPKSWKVIENPNAPQPGPVVAFLSPKESAMDTFQENVNIVVQDLGEKPPTLDQYVAKALDQLTGTFNDIEVSENVPVTVGDLHGRKIVYAGKEKSPLKFMTVIFVEDDMVLSIYYTADAAKFDQSRGEVEAMVGSLR